MAEFGIQATQLSAPQGAGSNPISPTTASWMDNGVAGAITGIADIFQKGLQNDAKAKAEQLKQGVVSGYVRQQARINDAIASGQISPVEAKTRSRALFTQYAAGYSEYIEDIDKAGKALRGFSELGDVEDKVKTAEELEKSRIANAQSAGFVLTDTMSPQQKETILSAYEAGKRADEEFRRAAARSAEARAQGTFEQGIADRQAKETSIRLITDVADKNMEASFALGSDIAAQVRAGKLTPEAGKLQWSQSLTRINAQIQAVAATNPELAAPYRSLFNELGLTVEKLMDPATELKTAEDQVKLVIARSKLVALADPTIRSATAVSQLLGGSAEIALSSSAAVTQAIVRNSSGNAGMGATDTVIGKPEVEKDYFKVLSNGIDKLSSKGYSDEPTARREITNNINETFRQVGEALNKGADAKVLKNAADFFASPQFAKYATENQLDQSAIDAAKTTFQLVYEPQVLKAVNTAMQTTFATSFMGNIWSTPENTKGFKMEDLDATFTGSGVKFKFKTPASSEVEAQAQQKILKQLESPQKALNQLLHIRSHVDGNTDYAATWESTKHILLPSQFSKYSNLNIGDIKDGYRYKGGDAKSASSWEPVNGR